VPAASVSWLGFAVAAATSSTRALLTAPTLHVATVLATDVVESRRDLPERCDLDRVHQRLEHVLPVPCHLLQSRQCGGTSVSSQPVARTGEIQVFSPEEVWALVRAAVSPTDAALFLTAAFTGLRLGELLALCWRDVDFTGSVIRVRASYAAGALTSPKSGKVRALPMAPDVATALARLGERKHWVGDDDLVFHGPTGSYLDGSGLRKRYKAALTAAGLRQLRFHDLRHTFGTRMIAKTDIRRVQEWMGHADVQTTMRYLHYAPRAEDAALVAEAFELSTTGSGAAT
jgi:integrase